MQRPCRGHAELINTATTQKQNKWDALRSPVQIWKMQWARHTCQSRHINITQATAHEQQANHDTGIIQATMTLEYQTGHGTATIHWLWHSNSTQTMCSFTRHETTTLHRPQHKREKERHETERQYKKYNNNKKGQQDSCRRQYPRHGRWTVDRPLKNNLMQATAQQRYTRKQDSCRRGTCRLAAPPCGLLSTAAAPAVA